MRYRCVSNTRNPCRALFLHLSSMNEAELTTLANSLIQQHLWGEIYEWRFAIDRAKRRFWCCHYQSHTISISWPLALLNSEEQIRDTILHEIAHAMAPRAWHGWRWRQACIQIWAKPQRCYGEEVTKVEKKFKGVCPTCQREILRHRKKQISCGKCSLRYSPEHAFIWTTIN